MIIPESAFDTCIKKPIPVKAIQMDIDFYVDTLEGKAGDYLIIDTDGKRYPCKIELFDEIYEWID